jgi:outer membrane protein OmpA-like peptidoglycan-associated protein
MTGRAGRAALLALVATVALACAARRQDLIVVVPSADGHVGAVTVTAGARSATLDSANQAVRVDDGGAMTAVDLTDEEIRTTFGAARAATPIPPRRFTLYFEEGTEELVPESEGLLPAILADIRARPVAEIEVIGHTDRLAAADYNQRLSESRAGWVRDWLVAGGVEASTIRTTGRGERDPVVPTDDGVAEPRNRRVEVTIR